MMKVLVIRCSRPEWWYHRYRWKVFEVESLSSGFYAVPSLKKGMATPCIWKRDAIRIPGWLFRRKAM